MKQALRNYLRILREYVHFVGNDEALAKCIQPLILLIMQHVEDGDSQIIIINNQTIVINSNSARMGEWDYKTFNWKTGFHSTISFNKNGNVYWDDISNCDYIVFTSPLNVN